MAGSFSAMCGGVPLAGKPLKTTTGNGFIFKRVCVLVEVHGPLPSGSNAVSVSVTVIGPVAFVGVSEALNEYEEFGKLGLLKRPAPPDQRVAVVEPPIVPPKLIDGVSLHKARLAG